MAETTLYQQSNAVTNCERDFSAANKGVYGGVNLKLNLKICEKNFKTANAESTGT